MAPNTKEICRAMLHQHITSLCFCAVLLIKLVSVLVAESLGVPPCDRQRMILTDSYGLITSGDKEYLMDSYCEWLIKANSSRQYVSLTFTKMDTECSYDHIFVYDGDSYSSQLLGSFSGNTTPSTVTAKNGAMLILLYSDTNYVRTGIEAVYTITDCPLNCSEKGLCMDHKCVCDALQTGHACDINLCPSNCGNSIGRGECFASFPKGRCKCRSGYSGMDCSLPNTNKASHNTWHTLSPNGLFPGERAGHSGVYVEKLDVFYVFGGYNFGRVYGDLIAFDFSASTWTNLTQAKGPSARKDHTSVSYGSNFLIFGGELEDGSLSNELWLFNTSSHHWQLLRSNTGFYPPPLSKHSMTLVEDHWIYILGGSLSNYSFSSGIYRASLVNGDASWQSINPRRGKQSSRRMLGHTAVFYKPLKSIVVYGGVIVEYSHVSKLSHYIYLFHVEKNIWSKISYYKDKNTPLERAFHTAAVVGDYMVVFGGYTHRHLEEEICYDNETYLYHLRCQKWLNMKHLRENAKGSHSYVSKGLFSHAMAVRYGHTLLIHGGYSGIMHSALAAYVLPPYIASDSGTFCESYRDVDRCTMNLACGWCPEMNVCVRRNDNRVCKNLVSESCPGLCPTLNSCQSCLIWGDPSQMNAIDNDSHLDSYPANSCAWCVQAMLCFPLNEAPYFCYSHTEVLHSGSGQSSQFLQSRWWGINESVIYAGKECYADDSPPGLLSIKYRHPVNWSQPDDVTLLAHASEELNFRSEIPRNMSSGVEENVVKFLAFLHPLGARPLYDRMSRLQLYMCSSGSNAVLRISNDTLQEHLRVVANHTTKTFYCSDVHQPAGSRLFPDMINGHKYLLDFTVNLSTAINETATMHLAWNAYSIQPEVISYQYLEPYKNGSCLFHTNCLACLTDNACGWCEPSSQCFNKYNVSEDACYSNGESHYLVVQPNSCSVCSDNVYCEDCIQHPLCEWLVEAAYCVRRGRFKNAVYKHEKCPVHCHLRTNCTSCLGDPGVCAWCEATQTCFLFSTYTSSYMFGRCRDWVDENRSEPHFNPISLCRDCSRHTACKHCLRDLSCGWCSLAINPLVGVCVQGDFHQPYKRTCLAELEELYNRTLTDSSQWSYGYCPDVEECLLGLHDCHQNATCRNTPQSYVCHCNVGFQGDGKDCKRACAVTCVNGICSNAPDYKCICDLGWSGIDCSIDCGCNNHSFCSNGPGNCDKCEDFTEGKFCEKCQNGSYGDATTSLGCQKCDCNLHGDPELNHCDINTGVCFCLDNTEGTNCSRCIPGYYGDPRNGGHCFEECTHRGVITNVKKGRLGSSLKYGSTLDCLWILTVHPMIDVRGLSLTTPSNVPQIELTIQRNIKVFCPHNHVYVYDGIPEFIYSRYQNKVLGNFCGSNISEPITITASSGFMTIHYKHNSLEESFSASYKKLDIVPDVNQTLSVTPTTNPDCEVCPNNCSGSQNHGVCGMNYGKCICENGHGGDDCSVTLKPFSLVWTSIYNYVKALEKSIDMPPGRIGHSLLSVNSASKDFENLWLFGGYSPTLGDLNDIYMFESFRREWIKIESEKRPHPRHFQAAATFKEHIYIFGGINRKTGLLNDFWKFNIVSHLWTHLKGEEMIEPIAGGTLTATDDGILYLIGGMSNKNGFYEKILVFDVETEEWTFLNSTGAQPIGLYAHSCVFHRETNSLYVFGGVSYETDSVIISNNLYVLNCLTGHWARQPSDILVNPPNSKPEPRYFHSAVVTKNYMIVTGGRSFRDGPNSYAYVFACNLWVSLEDEDLAIVGRPQSTFIGGSAAYANGDIYLFGGFDGELKKLSLPADFCQLFSATKEGCIHHTGCGFCSVSENGVNHTFCYAQIDNIPSSCYNPVNSSEVVPAVRCDVEWLEKRSCAQYDTCSDCVATFAILPQAKQVCQWCSNCKIGRCIPIGTSCEAEKDCMIPREVTNETSMCPLRSCWAADCHKCGALGPCIWTRQVRRSSGSGIILNKKPIYNWICVKKEIQDTTEYLITSSPPLECPVPCMDYKNCTSCLTSTGGEGGWHQCFWSETAQTCMSPSYELLACEDGSCGPVLLSNVSHCPIPCWHYSQASHCLSHANCGWCAFSGSQMDGRGLCIEGGILGPTKGICHAKQVLLLKTPLPPAVARLLATTTGPPKWHYLYKPPENECANGHHTCDDRHEVCVDTIEGFECHCKQGYEMKGEDPGECKPICRIGCFNGTCIRPDVCKCNFGYVGDNCSVACKCNGHSHCPGIDALEICPECRNNTQGPHCQRCQKHFVGNPANGGKCISCKVYCHDHSTICLNSELINNDTQSNQTYMNELIENITEGAWSDAVCIKCQNNTEGIRCDQCISGYFKAGENFEDGCRPCECHGHGDTCNSFNGENCNCQNNTENDRQCSQKNAKNVITPCWQLQCTKCKEYFLGAPASSHQCYRHMFLDKDYCFDPNNQDECNRKPNPLLAGRTVYFAVQPRYMNVDIRIIVDVTEGAIDFLLSAKEDTFIVDVNKTTGIHVISIDRKYGSATRNDFQLVYNENFTLNTLKKRDTMVENKEYPNSTEPYISSSLRMSESKSKDLTTYITVRKSKEFLVVRNLNNRLIVTIPQEVHDLRSTRFYMILRGVGNRKNPQTYGSLFFRQDQTRIDLFVFFSVFFSCFFLFLAICVIVWKVKQAFDVRSARRLHAAEMKHMASRPFGRVITIVDDDVEDDYALYSPTNCRKKLKANTKGRDSPKINEERFYVRPIAYEPLVNGTSAVATILVQLPGGAQSLVKMTLASALIMTRASHYHVGCGIRAAMRRRTSHTV